MINYGNSVIISQAGYWLNKYNDPYNPLDLPHNTIRVRTSNGNPPIKDTSTTYETATLVAGTTDIYDVYKRGTTFESLLYSSTNVVEVLGANTTGITNMTRMFAGCESLVSIPLFDTSSVTDMQGMFSGCRALTSVPLFDTSSVTDMLSMFFDCSTLTSVPLFDTSSVTTMYTMFYRCRALTSIPLFDTSNVTDMYRMFYYCTKVESGALALYQQASSQANPPTTYNGCFYECGSDTTTGAAELAQIPSNWK